MPWPRPNLQGLPAVGNPINKGYQPRRVLTMREEGKIHVEVFVIGLIVALSYARAAFLLVTG